MKFKTTIQIVSEAKDKHEAFDIAGEYLTGNISSGVDMKYATRPYYSTAMKVTGAATVFAVVMAACLMIPQVRHSSGLAQNGAGISAVQPPLKTSNINKANGEFRNEWKAKQTAEALNVIKK